VTNENHWLTQEIREHQQKLAKMGRWVIYGQSEQLKSIWKKIQRCVIRELSSYIIIASSISRNNKLLAII
jgi:hypothetical protein